MTTSEEGKFTLRDDNYIPLSADEPAGELTEEEQLVLALKASMDIALKESVARVESFLFGKALDNLLIL